MNQRFQQLVDQYQYHPATHKDRDMERTNGRRKAPRFLKSFVRRLPRIDLRGLR